MNLTGRLANPLKLFFDQTNMDESKRAELCRRLFKRFYRQAIPAPEPESLAGVSCAEQKEKSQPANPKRQNMLLSDDENEAVL